MFIFIFLGCDRKHEEEKDSEAIYKDFIIGVRFFSFLYFFTL